MKIRRTKHFKHEVSTSSLNDIMFFLLLFFLIVSTLANPNVIKVLLPTAKTTQQINKQQITLTITADKKYFINQKEVLFNDLEPTLKLQTSGIENPTLILRVAKSLNVQDLVDVLEIGVKLNLKVLIATDKTNS
jgi:biopolymer transport protein ExbD